MNAGQPKAETGGDFSSENPLGFPLYAGVVLGLAFFWQFFRYTNIASIAPADIDFFLGETGVSPALVFYVLALAFAFVCVFVKPFLAVVVRVPVVAASGVLASVCVVVALQGGGSWTAGGALIVFQVLALVLFSLSFVALTAAWAQACARIAALDLKKAIYCLCVSCLASFVISFGLFSLSPFSQYFIAVVPACSTLLLLFVVSKVRGTAERQPGLDKSSAGSSKGIVILLVTLLVVTTCIKGLCDLFYTGGAENMLVLKHFITIVELVVIMSVCLFTVSVNKLAFLGWIVLTGGLVSGLVFLFFADSSLALQIGLGTITAAKTCFELFVFVMVAVDRRLGSAPRMALALIVVPETVSYLIGYGLLPSLAASYNASFESMIGVVSLGLAAAIAVSAFVIVSSLALKSFDEGGSAGLSARSDATVGSDADAGVMQAVAGGGAGSGAAAYLPEAAAEIEARFEELSEEYGLTRRERETALLVFRGYSAKRIAEIQYVSLNTVQTHTRNVYRKLNIHSRQDLIDVVEEHAG